MEPFTLNQEFTDFESVLKAKKMYEKVSNTVLTISSSKPIVGDGELKAKFVYERLLYGCKAGTERPTSSKGLRASSTYKKGCPVKVRLALDDKKLIVKDINLTHENHSLDEATYKHYPENMRLDPSKKLEVEKMVDLGVNKHKLKADLMGDGQKVISLKYLHNIQTKVNQRKHGTSEVDVLEKLLKKMEEIQNAKIRVVVNTENELLGIYFQDERMAKIFERYPELMLYDASYKLNNVDMPLFTQMCVDGNGESEICSIYVTRSESYLNVGTMIDIFQSTNPAWTKTKIILGDKDFADREVYCEKYPDAVLQICLFHVLVAMNREITTAKRDITTNERKTVLELIQRIVYSESEDSYNSLYNELMDLNLEKVNKYFNDNWHNIRNEWTQFGKNVHANYMNATNNRTESINQKFKIVGSRHANLMSFFENVFTTVSVLSSERDIRAVKITMRVPRKRFADDSLAKYNNHLTPFIFKKLELQYELSDLIQFAVIECESAVTAKQNGNGHTVTERHCTCPYFSAMQIPCRHLFKFWLSREMDLFQPDTCAVRWTKSYYYDSHPAINAFEYVAPRPPTHVVSVRVPSEIDKYKKTATVTKDINNLMSNMSNSQFDFFLEKIRDVRTEMIGQPLSMPSGIDLSSIPISSTQPHDNQPRQSEPSSTSRIMHSSNRNEQSLNRDALQQHRFIENINQALPEPATQISQPQMLTSTESVDSNRIDVNPPSSRTIIQSSQPQVTTNNSVTSNKVQPNSMSQPVVPNTALQRITLPPKNVSVGRPKGSGNTVIGVKRKASQKTTATEKKKFLEKDLKEQGVLIATWLTNWPSNQIGQRKITLGDIIQDPHTFNRLRHKQIKLVCIKSYLDKKTFKYIEDEVIRLKKKPYACRKCQRNLSGTQVMCHGCLDWYHDKCIQLPPGETTRNVDYFCADCQ